MAKKITHTNAGVAERFAPLISAAIAQCLGQAGRRFTVEVGVGRPGATRTFSTAANLVLIHVRVARDWRHKVWDQGLAVIDGRLCLRAQRVPIPRGADGAWRVLVFSPLGGESTTPYAVSFGGITRLGATAALAYEGCLSVFRQALLGED